MKLVMTLTETNCEHPPLVLIHGLGSAATAFKPIITALSQSFRTITVDLPGHGQTPMDEAAALDPQSLGMDIFDILDSEYGIKKFHVVGNSLGGWIALEMAAAQPERIQSLTGLAPAGLWLEPSSSRLPSEARAYYVAKALKPIFRVGLRYKLLRKIGFGSVSPKWHELSYEICYNASFAMANSVGYFPVWDAMLGKRFDAKVSASVPVTILFGDSDNTLPIQTSQERTLAPAHCAWLVIDDCGHAPMWDHPDLIVKIIKQTSGV